jgi:hypothetical protein
MPYGTDYEQYQLKKILTGGSNQFAVNPASAVFPIDARR